MQFKTAYGRLYETAQTMLSADALKYFGNNITYGQLMEYIDTAAQGFSEIGVKSGDVVAVSLLNSPSAVITFYALDKIGVMMHMVNCAAGIEEIERELKKIPSSCFVLNDLFYSNELKKVFYNNSGKKMVCVSLCEFLPHKINKFVAKYLLIEKLKGLSGRKLKENNLLSFSALLKIGAESKKQVLPAEYDDKQRVAVAYTSGSTGESKAVVASWKSIDSLVQIMAMTEQGRFAAGDVMLSSVPIWIYYSLINMLHEPLVLGVALAFDPVFDAAKVADLNNLYHFNHWLTSVAYMEKAVKANKKTDCSGWKIVLTGGSALGNKLKTQADCYIKENGGNAEVAQGYGASELLGSFAYGYIPNATIGSVGVPCIGNMIRIVDPDTKEELKHGETGLCLVYSPSVMKEYYHDEEATNSVLLEDESGAIWYNTGDLVYQNEKSELFLVGRLKRMELTIDEYGNPAKLVPDEISRIICELDMVEQCEVITVPDEKVYNFPVAFIVLKNAEKDENILGEIRSYCYKNLATYKVPKDFRLCDNIPIKPSSNKVDYEKLKQIYYNSATEK